MDLFYFNRQMRDELHGAKNYIQMAMECKQANPTRARMFVDMSSAELSHATNLQKMFEDAQTTIYNQTNDESFREFLNDFHTEVVGMYSEETSNIKYMHEMYGK